MKKIFFSLLFPLWGLGGLSAQVSVSNMATDYPASKVSFTVTWTAQPHNDQIWVIVDYIKVQDASTAGNTWKRALVTAVARNSGTGSAATVTGQRGFWLHTSGSSGSANVTATLSLDSGVQQYNWCAYALNYPPEAKIKAEGGYDLYGTPPFTVNGTTLLAGNTTFGPGTCITSLTDATDNPSADLPATLTVSTSNPATRCDAGAVTLTASASGATTTAMTYTWTVGVAAAQTTSANTYAPTVAVGGATYSVTATNAAGCTSAAKTGTITVHALPTITYLSGSTAQTVTASSAITDIKYTTANASGAGISGQPSGVSGSWASNTYTVSGTPTAAGTFTYTVTTTNASGCDNASATGTIVVTQTAITYTNCTAPSLTLGAVGFTSSTTYSANGLTLSSPVTVTWCNARAYTSFDSGSTGPYKADCAQNYFSTAKGNWFSWCMVKQYESQLCPSPWRVPTPDDHCQIINGSPMDCAPNNSVITSDAGYSYTGLVINSTASNGEWQGYYWTSVEADPYTAYLLLLSYTTTTPATPYSKGYGLTLRCVQ